MVPPSSAHERWLNPFWFPSETIARFRLVLLAATCLTLFTVRRGLEAMGNSPWAWVWLVIVLCLTIWRLTGQSIRLLRHRLSLLPAEVLSPALAQAVARLTQDHWFSLDFPPQVWVTPRDISPFSFGLGHRKHIVLPQFLLDYYKPDERDISAELKAILGHEVAHIKNGDLRLKGLADIVFYAARDSLILWLLPTALWSALGSRGEPVASAGMALYLALALLGSFYLYRTALRWRELYADTRVTLSQRTGKSLQAGLATVNEILRHLLGTDKALARLSLPGLGVTAGGSWLRTVGRWTRTIPYLAWSKAPFRAYPTEEERTAALADPNRLFRTLDIPLVLLCGFLPTFVVGLAAGLLPRVAVETSLQVSLGYILPRWAKLVAEGQAEAYALLASVHPALVETVATPLVMALESTVAIALALYLLAAVLGVHLVYCRQGVTASLKISGVFVGGMLLAQFAQPTMLGLLLTGAGSARAAVGSGLAQSLVGILSLGLAVSLYLYLSGRLLQRYPTPAVFLTRLRRVTGLFIAVFVLESLVALPLTTTLDMLPTIA
jgi:Zn-dependent protease with chaperone function